ncbi:unnamed protein product, partial [Rotaria sp. Silwood2]
MLASARMPSCAQLQQKFSDHMTLNQSQLPRKMNLRSEMTPVEDQSQIGSCVANAFAGAYEYLLNKSSGRHIDVSRLFIYYNARAKDAYPPGHITDSGCSITSALETLKELGTCEESLWPYDLNSVHAKPNELAYDKASENQIMDALSLNVDLHEMKSCLAQGYPFVFGLVLFKSFDKASKKGYVPMPQGYEGNRESHGRHAMLAVGYNDHSNSFIVRNSWSARWGDEGYCYIPYDYMTNRKLCFEPYTVRQLEADDIGDHDRNYDDDDDRRDHEDSDDDDDDDDDAEISGVEDNDDDSEHYGENSEHETQEPQGNVVVR